MCLKEIWGWIFYGYLRNFARETFLGDEHMMSSSTKTAKRINFILCTHISKRLLHKTVPAFFLIMSNSFLIAIIQEVLKAYFAWKQLKVDYSKKYLKRRKSWARFCLSLCWVHISDEKLSKTSILLVQELID